MSSARRRCGSALLQVCARMALSESRAAHAARSTRCPAAAERLESQALSLELSAVCQRSRLFNSHTFSCSPGNQAKCGFASRLRRRHLLGPGLKPARSNLSCSMPTAREQ
eukprot:363824-Chlamydomonas_euryale.AAC.7